MKKLYDITSQLNLISNRSPFNNTVVVGDIASALFFVAKEVAPLEIEVVISQKDFSVLGSTIMGALKNGGAKTSLLIFEDDEYHYATLKKSLNANLSAVVAVGDNALLSAIRRYLSTFQAKCYAVPTTPCIENILLSDSLQKPFEKVIVDENVISKGDLSYFAESYISTMSKLISLIDYKINCFLSGAPVDEEVFSITKQAINTLAKLTSYENFKSAILGAQLLLASLDGGVFEGSGIEVIKTCLSYLDKNLSSSQKTLAAFEKTAKIYHMYFSNDFSSLLSVPDYESDIGELEKITGKSRDYFYKNLKIPSERRRKLIALLMQKTRDDFKRETTLILSVLPSIIKIYDKLNNKERKTISYKQIKNAVCLGAYLTDKTSTLTLCRDEGILKCAN